MASQTTTLIVDEVEHMLLAERQLHVGRAEFSDTVEVTAVTLHSQQSASECCERENYLKRIWCRWQWRIPTNLCTRQHVYDTQRNGSQAHSVTELTPSAISNWSSAFDFAQLPNSIPQTDKTQHSGDHSSTAPFYLVYRMGTWLYRIYMLTGVALFGTTR